jgi:diacylglycerol kinase family enzyme
VDLGAVQSHTFVNNVSFGLYADALLEPGYREAKARSFASVTPAYLEGHRSISARIETPSETIEAPQVVLVSNNPYHLATLRFLGHRFSLRTGMLGVVVVKHQPVPPPPALVADVHRDLRHTGGADVPGSGVVVWSATEVGLHGDGSILPAGIDGEPVQLRLPITVRVRPSALTVHLPADRPGAPPEPGT